MLNNLISSLSMFVLSGKRIDVSSKRKLITCLIISAFISSINIFAIDYQTYLYEEGFEGTDPVTFWDTKGTYTANSVGITTAKAYSGTHSYVIDITMNSGEYFYWKIPLPDIPCENQLKFSAKIWIEQVSGTKSTAGLGHNAFYPPTGITGCNNYKAYGDTNNQWLSVEGDAVDFFSKNLCYKLVTNNIWGALPSNVGTRLDRIGFFIRNDNGSSGDRIRVYVDDIKLEGIIPTSASYTTEVTNRWAPYQTKFNTVMNQFSADYASAQNAINNLSNPSSFEQELKNKAQQFLTEIINNYSFININNRGWIGYSEYNPIRYRLSQAKGLIDNINMERSDMITREKHIMYNVVPCDKTVQSVLPDASFIYARIDNEINMTAALGEYESASFAIEAYDNLSDVSVAVTDLTRTGGGTISSSDVDIRVVKCWYQSGEDIYVTYTNGVPNKILVPELLLKDDSLISVNYITKENYAKLDGSDECISNPVNSLSTTLEGFPIVDSSTLLPVDIADDYFKQFWITVKAPNEVAGEYTGYITLTTPGDGEIGKYPIKVNVLPFKLEDSPIKYSIYYRGITVNDGSGSISSEEKTTEQYTAEMKDLINHGITIPMMYQNIVRLNLVENELAIRQNLGMNKDELYCFNVNTGYSEDPIMTDAKLLALKNSVTALIELTSDYGIIDNYMYGIDEPEDQEYILLMQREAWETIHEAGGKVIVSSVRKGCLGWEFPWGIIGNWHFDEATGTIANDSSSGTIIDPPYENHGTLTNMSSPSCWVSGKVENALSFDGVDDYVLVGDVCDMGQNDFSISAWVKSTSTASGNNSNGIVYKRITASSSSPGYRLSMPNGQFNFYIADGTNYKGLTVGNAGQYNDGQWHHVAAVADRGSSLSIYVDGVLKDNISETTVGNIDSTISLAIGALKGANTYYHFDGLIDEVKIFSRVLEAREIAREYSDGNQGIRKVVGDLKNLHISAKELSFDEADECHSFSGNEIFSYNNPHSGPEDPEISRRNFGLQLWRYGYDGACNYAYQAAGGGHIWNDYDGITVPAGTYRGMNYAYPTTNGVIDTIAWEGFREGVDDNKYIATLLKAIDDSPASQSKTDAVNFVDSLKETERLDVDDLNDVREEAINYILQLCAPSGAWHFDETTGYIASDSSAGNNDGVLTNMSFPSCWVTGQEGNALEFDGVDDYVLVGDVCDMGENDFSISTWVKSTSTLSGINNNGIVFKRITTGNAAGYSLSMPNGQFNFAIADGTNYKNLLVGNTGEYNDGEWHHVVAVADRGSSLYIYVDGTLKDTVSETNVGNIDSTISLALGALKGVNSYFHFDGKIDEVKIFPRVLSEGEIQRNCQGWD